MTTTTKLGEGNGNPLQYSCLENPMDGGACWLPSMGLQRVGHDWATSLTSYFITGEGNGDPLEYSCLENPKGPWRAMVHGVAESDTTEVTKIHHKANWLQSKN